ncbi:low molecular weight protein-tyrosine-phosphatase [Thermoflavimicrobium dichotomicum]|uniref:protein-tyrosine-phosphatase n=1 Tax=Thermoflavimicrobium dichotomicum TaxID=46223 RepID=A0A1I3R757_9BACL|nr:low molecular weight protein-tyrosine-phosphatase [Thermoflavimicrobium dichotomicum]SFJ41612.1 protein-tyrosine phosphatase [Thermoflavimicrobium dichotomicum]
MVSVLFVCLGNICRSPMAEAVFRHYVHEAGLSKHIRIDSAGTGNWHVGEPPHHGTRSKLKEKGISYEGIYARQVTIEDFDQFDYIIGMDENNIQSLHRLAKDNQTNIYRFVDFIPEFGYTEVPDPWYTGDFDETYRLVEAGCKNLLDKIIKEHPLK